MRLYCKSAEIMRNPDRAFFREIWNVPEDAEVWRVEFEIKRPALKEMGINDVYVLFRQFKSLWNYLTRQWVSMRTGEDKNKSRRPLSDFWQAVQNTESAFEGDQPIIRRVKEKSMPQAEWYLSRIRNYAETLAALWQKTSPAKVMNAIYANLQGCWAGAKFEQAVMEKAIQKGWPLVDGRDNDG
jgi:hypothetical protein